MASVTLQVGSQSVPLSAAQLKDLSLNDGLLDLKFILDGQLAALLSQPISSIKDGQISAITLDAGNPSWKLFGSPATFSLQAKATGTISIQSKGELFSFYRGYDDTDPDSITVPDGRVYIVTDIEFNLSGSLSATVQEGALGISTSDSASTKYIVRNYKAFGKDTKLGDALQTAIGGFTLPLHAKSAENLDDGDCLYYEFDGTINVGFGVTYGFSKSVGAFSVSDLSSAFQKYKSSVDFSTSDLLTVQASAGLSAKFNWSRVFQCCLVKSKPDSTKPGTAVLHLSAGKDSTRSLTMKFNGGISKVSPPQLTVSSDALATWLVSKISSQAPIAAPIIQKITGAAQQEVAKYVSDANNWISGLFQKVDSNGNLALTVMFQSTSHFVSAFTWDFDLANKAFAQTWQSANDGDYVQALATGAATLEAGSGFEQMHTKSTQITFTFFGLLNYSSIETYFDQSTLRYGGNGIFYLETKAGRVAATSDNNAKTSSSVYLDARAPAAAANVGTPNSADVTIEFHIILAVSDNPAQTSRMGVILQTLAGLVSSADSQGTLIAAGKMFKDFSRQAHPGPCTIHCVYGASALNRLQSDEYANGNQPPPPHALDARNWDACAWASDQVKTDVLNYFQTWGIKINYEDYNTWAVFNCVANQFTDPDGNPQPDKKTDRHLYGNLDPADVRRVFGPALSDTAVAKLSIYFGAGQQYMNLCDDIHSTMQQIKGATVDWERISAKLRDIADGDIDAWYGPVIALALAKSCQSIEVSVPTPKAAPNDFSMSVTLNIS